MTAPERIWAWCGSNGGVCATTPSPDRQTEYVRADLATPPRAELPGHLAVSTAGDFIVIFNRHQSDGQAFIMIDRKDAAAVARAILALIEEGNEE